MAVTNAVMVEATAEAEIGVGSEVSEVGSEPVSRMRNIWVAPLKSAPADL